LLEKLLAWVRYTRVVALTRSLLAGNHPLNLAVSTLGRGANQYLLVSALAANKRAWLYYSCVKGEVEEGHHIAGRK
jgi:hypothetical protein